VRAVPERDVASRLQVHERRNKIVKNRGQITENKGAIEQLMRWGGGTKVMGSSVLPMVARGPDQSLVAVLCRCLPEMIERTSGRAPAEPSAPSGTGGMISADVRSQIHANRLQLFAVSGAVYDSLSQAYHARSLVQENAALIAKIYSTAFNGNRQLTNQNTDDLFRNRLAIVRGMHKDERDEVHRMYVDAMMQSERIHFLQHRAALNHQVLELSLMMADVNANAIRNNNAVMKLNEEVVDFNRTYIEENARWITEVREHGVGAHDPAKVAAMVQANAEALADLTAKNKQLEKSIEACLGAAKKNYDVANNRKLAELHAGMTKGPLLLDEDKIAAQGQLLEVTNDSYNPYSAGGEQMEYYKSLKAGQTIGLVP
jgi:hypothetical protein